MVAGAAGQRVGVLLSEYWKRAHTTPPPQEHVAAVEAEAGRAVLLMVASKGLQPHITGRLGILAEPHRLARM